MRVVVTLASVLIGGVVALAVVSRNVSLILGPSVYTAGSTPIVIASADLDVDSMMDLAVTNYGSDDVSVLWGNGDGTFTPGASTFSVGTSCPSCEFPVAIAIADVNGDGKLDIITANEYAGTVTALLNLGGRTFAGAKESSTGTSPEAIAAGDFDGDGKLDVATADSLDDTVSVLKGNGKGTFSILSVLPVGSEPYGLAAVDLNHDGILDLVVANSLDNSLTVFQGQGSGGKGNGTFLCVAGSDRSCRAPEITSSTFDDPVSITVADLDGDGNPDLVVVNDDGNSLSVLLGNGDLTFQNAFALKLSEDSVPEGAVVADLNGDGIPDIASPASFLDKVSVFVGQGKGNFAAPVDFALPVGSAPWGITAGDFNGDGAPDLGVADETDPGTVSVLLNASEVALASGIGATDTSITLTEAGSLPASGIIVIDEEWIIYTGKQGNTLTGVIRGANGTVAAAHAAGATVTFIPSTGCVGDCGETGSVDVEDILRMVNIALGNLPTFDCEAGDANSDGQITVDEVLTAVSNALNGCGT